MVRTDAAISDTAEVEISMQGANYEIIMNTCTITHAACKCEFEYRKRSAHRTNHNKNRRVFLRSFWSFSNVPLRLSPRRTSCGGSGSVCPAHSGAHDSLRADISCTMYTFYLFIGLTTFYSLYIWPHSSHGTYL